jgi:hypothetical protein
MTDGGLELHKFPSILCNLFDSFDSNSGRAGPVVYMRVLLPCSVFRHNSVSFWPFLFQLSVHYSNNLTIQADVVSFASP